MKLSRRIYRLLLLLYPRDHRHRYGRLMALHFDDQLGDAAGARAVARLWLRTLVDLLRSLPAEHADWARQQNIAPWHEVLLAVIPGLIMLLPGLRSDQVELSLLLTLTGFYLLLLFVRRGRSIAWALPLLGLGLTFVAGAAAGLLLGAAGGLLLLLSYLPAIGLTALLRSRRVVASALLLLLSLIAALLLSDGSAAGREAALLGPAVILLAAALGFPFARRYGLIAALFVAGGAFWAIELAIDPSVQLRWGGWAEPIKQLHSATTLLLIPLLALRARSQQGQALAVILPLSAYLLLLIVAPPLLAPDAAAGWQPAHALAAVQIVSAMLFALALYDRRRAPRLTVFT